MNLTDSSEEENMYAERPSYLRALEENHGRDSRDFASSVVFFVAVAACFLWCCGPSLLGCVKNFCWTNSSGNRPSRQRSQVRQDALESAIESIIQSANESERARAAFLEMIGGTPRSGQNFESACRERRKAFINQVIMTKIYVPEKHEYDSKQENSVVVETSNQDNNNKNSTPTNNKSKEDRDHENDTVAKENIDTSVIVLKDGRDCCVICFDLYVEGEEVAWSQNENCSHEFHIHCIVEWLLEHDDCPICRNYFLFFTNNQEDGSVPESGRLALNGRETIGANDDDVSENSLPPQLLRGLEMFYRA